MGRKYIYTLLLGVRTQVVATRKHHIPILERKFKNQLKLATKITTSATLGFLRDHAFFFPLAKRLIVWQNFDYKLES